MDSKISSIKNVNWNYPTPIWFGLNRIKEINFACDEYNIKNHIIVTDPGIMHSEINSIIILMF